MASGTENVNDGNSLAPENFARRTSSRCKSPVIQAPGKMCLITARQFRRGKNEDTKSLLLNLPENNRRAQNNVGQNYVDINHPQAR